MHARAGAHARADHPLAPLLAFLGISGFAVLATLAALYSFAEVGRVLDRITRERVPGTVAALELSRQAERIVSAAPALLAVDTKGKLRDVSEGIAIEVRQLEQLVANLGMGGLRTGALAQIEPAVEGLRRNLAALDGLMAQRLDIAARRQARLDQLSSTTIATMRLLAPGILVMHSRAAQWRRADGEVAADASARRAATAALGEAISAYLPQQKAHIEASAINETLLKRQPPAPPPSCRCTGCGSSARSPRSRRWRRTSSRPRATAAGTGQRPATPGGWH